MSHDERAKKFHEEAFAAALMTLRRLLNSKSEIMQFEAARELLRLYNGCSNNRPSPPVEGDEWKYQ